MSALKQRILDLRAQGMTNAQIADEVGISRQRVYQLIGKQPDMSEQRTQEMLAMRDRGMTNQGIAEALGISLATVYRIIGRDPQHGVPRIGTSIWLTEEADHRVREIAEQFGCVGGPGTRPTSANISRLMEAIGTGKLKVVVTGDDD